jgi:hypothetical protein
MAKQQVTYLSRDFTTIREDLIQYLKSFFPEQWQDFNIASPGMALLELNAYVADLLSYVADKKFNELFLDSAQERNSIYRLAKTHGYKVPGVRPAVTVSDFIIEVPATAEGPDASYLPVYRAGVKIKGAGQIFETVDEIDFSNDFSEEGIANRIIEPILNGNQDLVRYRIVKREKIKAGVTKIFKKEVTADEAGPFFQLTLPDTNVLEITSVIIKGSVGLTSTPTFQEFNDDTLRFYEVDYLPENKIFEEDDTEEGVSGIKIGRYKTVEQRFEKEFLPDGRCRLTFGSGAEDAGAFDSFMTNMTDIINCDDPTNLNVANLLDNHALGEKVEPNTTIYVKYRAGGGLLSNVGANTLQSVSDINAIILGADATLNQTVIQSTRANNPIPALGGVGLPLAEEIKHFIAANYAAQNRCVTLEDYISRAQQIPGKFGAPFRIYGKVEDNKVKMYILSRDGNGKLVTSSTNVIKNNLQRYLVPYRMLNDFVEINDGKVVNLQVETDVLIDRTFNISEVKGNIINTIKNFFNIENWQMNQHIYVSQINDIIRDVPGVINVVDIRL